MKFACEEYIRRAFHLSPSSNTDTDVFTEGGTAPPAQRKGVPLAEYLAFSILGNSFGETQTQTYEDYIEYSLMAQFNNRTRD